MLWCVPHQSLAKIHWQADISYLPCPIVINIINIISNRENVNDIHTYMEIFTPCLSQPASL